MSDRYIVLPVAEARSSGKRAAGFAFRADAEAVCSALNRGRHPFVGWGNEWAYDECVCAIIDTHTPADGSPTAEGGGGERRPSAKWDNFAPGLHALDIIGEWGAMVEEPPQGHDSAGTRYGVGGKCLGTVPGRDAVAAKVAAEDAAARLAIDALLALGPAAEGMLREAMGRVGK